MNLGDLIQALIEKQMVIGMCYVDSEFDRGRVQGLQDAIDLVSDFSKQTIMEEKKK